MSSAQPEVSRTEIEESITSILGDMLGLEPDTIELSDRLNEDLDLDSMDAVDMVVDLKVRTGIKLLESDLKTAETVLDIVEVAHDKTQS